MASSTSADRHVAVLEFPFATHPGVLFGLVRTLAMAAPNVTFTFFNTAGSNTKIFEASDIPSNIKRSDMPDGVPEGYVFAGHVEEEIGMFLKVAPENFKTGVAATEEHSGRRVCCVVADAFLWFSGDMAAEMGVSWVPVWISGAGSLLLHVYTDLIRQTVRLEGMTGREDEIVTFIHGFSKLRLGDLPGGIVSGNLDSPLSVMLHKMGRALPRATAMPINSFEELDPPIVDHLKTRFSNFLSVGPFNVTSPPPSSNNLDEYDCISWLDKQTKESVAYLAFGTVATPPPNELQAIAEALEENKTFFLWSLGDNFMCHLPEGFLERTRGFGKIVPWAPQVKVLGHASIGVFINHGGWNSILESITAGVPIICRPFFGDHHLNTWMVEKVWGVGVRIEGGVFTKIGTMDALELVLAHDMRKALKRQVDAYKDLVQKAVGPNGSSTQCFNMLSKVIIGENP